MNDEFGDPLRATHDRPFKLNANVLKIVMPFRMQISGASGAGKTKFVLEMIKHKSYIFSAEFVRIIYCYPFEDRSVRTKDMIAAFKKVYRDLEEHDGLPDAKKQSLVGKNQHALIIVDDLASKFYASANMADLFANTSSHDLLSFVVCTQNTFPKGAFRRDIAVNLTHYCILRNCADQLSIGTLSRHLTNRQHFFGTIMHWLEDQFTKKEDKYLMVNCHGDSIVHTTFKYCTGIFPTINAAGHVEDARPIFFIPD